MPTEVMLAVLFAALLHAGWNAIAKAGGGTGGDALIDTTALLLAASLVAAICLPLLPLPAPASWPYILASGVVNVGYFWLLSAAYRAGDMSLTYPLMRGGAPLLTALFSGLLFGETFSAGTIAGIVLTCSGVLGMAFARRGAHWEWRAIGFALGNAVVIAVYTLIDGFGARRSHSPFAYTLAVFIVTCIGFAPFVAFRHGARLRAVLLGRWHLNMIGGAAIVVSYAIALWAMTRAPIATVAALRECSILFGMILARVLLGEQPHAARLAGGALIVAGAVALRLG